MKTFGEFIDRKYKKLGKLDKKGIFVKNITKTDYMVTNMVIEMFTKYSMQYKKDIFKIKMIGFIAPLLLVFVGDNTMEFDDIYEILDKVKDFSLSLEKEYNNDT